MNAVAWHGKRDLRGREAGLPGVIVALPAAAALRVVAVGRLPHVDWSSKPVPSVPPIVASELVNHASSRVVAETHGVPDRPLEHVAAEG
jgi:hypothetical protein